MNRFGNDPRAFTLAIEFKNDKLPWFCVGYEDEWLSLNSMERCGRTVIDLIERSVKQYLKVVDKSRIYLIKYEDFLSNAEREIEEIAKFIGVQTTVYTSNILRSGLQMSMLDPEQRESKVRDLRNGMLAALFDKIMKLSCEYEENFYGLL